MFWVYYTLQSVLDGVVGGGGLELVTGLPAIHLCSRVKKKMDFFCGAALLDPGQQMEAVGII